jgi:2-haloacid dehalogenase
VTLTNGSKEGSERLFTDAGIRDQFDLLMSVEDSGAWKPAPASYAYAVRTCDTDPADLLLVAVHPWDIDGAARAGLTTAWINRTGAAYPASFTPPALQASGLTDLAAKLG